MDNTSIIGSNRERKSKIDFTLADKLNEEYKNVREKKNKVDESIQETPIGNSYKDIDGFIYVPSLNLYFAKEITLQGKNWYEAHRELQANNERMPTMPEFIEFLKYTQSKFRDVYLNTTLPRRPDRGEWLDADFKIIKERFGISYYNILDLNDNSVMSNSEILDKNTLIVEDHILVSLEDYLDVNHTTQGLPNVKVKPGNLYYFPPEKDNESVAWFKVDSKRVWLECCRNPLISYGEIGVRAVRQGGLQ